MHPRGRGGPEHQSLPVTIRGDGSVKIISGETEPIGRDRRALGHDRRFPGRVADAIQLDVRH